MQKKTLAIIGTGEAARTHIEAYNEMDHVEVKWVYSNTLSRAKAFSKKFDIPAYTSNYQNILGDNQVVFFDICNTPDLHIPFAEKALNSGKGVIIEKPISTDLSLAIRFYKNFRRSSLPVLVVYQYPYSETFSTLRQFFESREFGELKSYRVKYFSFMDEVFYTRWPAEKGRAGGGALLNHGIHFVNLVYTILGYTPLEILATSANIKHPVEVEDTIFFNVIHENGFLGAFQFSTGLPSELLIEFLFEDAYIWTRGGKVVVQTDRERTIQTPRKGDFRMLAEDFFSELETCPSVKMNLKEALWDLEIIQAVYASAKEGRVVRCDLCS